MSPFNKEGLQPITVWIDQGLHQQVRAKLAEDGISFRFLITRFLTAYVKKDPDQLTDPGEGHETK